MRRSGLWALAGITFAVALIALTASIISVPWDHEERIFQNAPKLVSALQAFTRDQVEAGRHLPPQVPLLDLVRAGYLTTKDVPGFEGLDVVFNTQTRDTQPQVIIARAQLPDGNFVCLLADGSVLRLSRARYEQHQYPQLIPVP